MLKIKYFLTSFMAFVGLLSFSAAPVSADTTTQKNSAVKASHLGGYGEYNGYDYQQGGHHGQHAYGQNRHHGHHTYHRQGGHHRYAHPRHQRFAHYGYGQNRHLPQRNWNSWVR